MIDRSHFYIPNYQLLAGPLTEFPPNDILREINDDLNTVINTALQFVERGTIGEQLSFMMNNTFNHVSRTLNEHGTVLENEQIIVYGTAIQNIGKAYMAAIATSPYWFTHYGKWIGAQYTIHSPGDVEFLLDYNNGMKFPQFSSPAAYERITPQLLPVVELLIGNLGGRL